MCNINCDMQSVMMKHWCKNLLFHLTWGFQFKRHDEKYDNKHDGDKCFYTIAMATRFATRSAALHINSGSDMSCPFREMCLDNAEGNGSIIDIQI